LVRFPSEDRLGIVLSSPPPDAPPETAPAVTVEAPFEQFEELIETKPPTLVRRLATTYRHFLGLLFGGLAAYLRDLAPAERHGGRYRSLRLVNAFTRHFVKRGLVGFPFAVQLRKRLELLGPTYIKLGQVLSLRSDLLPARVTAELTQLQDRLPAAPFKRFLELVAQDLGRDPFEVFAYIETLPLGSASIGQTHRAGTRDGKAVILKVVKPGIREVLRRDVALLRVLGRLLDVVFSRYQPRRAINEFCDYTLREVDLELEADNAEIFAANFSDEPDIVFPRVYHEYSGPNLLCLEFLRGIKPNSEEARRLSEADRDRVVDLGASAIIRMLYRDGFFHADLHPGNLLILPGPRVGFIDLGMVGRFDDQLRKSLLYYFYTLVMGDAESAARYLTAIATPGPGGDPQGFCREVEDVCRRFRRHSKAKEASIGQLILQSIGKGAKHRMYFPVEMVLMVKAIVTFEGVGNILKPGFDVAAVSRQQMNSVFLHIINPLRLARESLRGAPELLDTLVKIPILVTTSLKALEAALQRPTENPFAGMRGTMFAGFCLIAGAILAAFGSPSYFWGPFFILAGLIVRRPGR